MNWYIPVSHSKVDQNNVLSVFVYKGVLRVKNHYDWDACISVLIKGGAGGQQGNCAPVHTQQTSETNNGDVKSSSSIVSALKRTETPETSAHSSRLNGE
jgi:hypothetical protein